MLTRRHIQSNWPSKKIPLRAEWRHLAHFKNFGPFENWEVNVSAKKTALSACVPQGQNPTFREAGRTDRDLDA
jgi:hypothetical protein